MTKCPNSTCTIQQCLLYEDACSTTYSIVQCFYETLKVLLCPGLGLKQDLQVLYRQLYQYLGSQNGLKTPQEINKTVVGSEWLASLNRSQDIFMKLSRQAESINKDTLSCRWSYLDCLHLLSFKDGECLQELMVAEGEQWGWISWVSSMCCPTDCFNHIPLRLLVLGIEMPMSLFWQNSFWMRHLELSSNTSSLQLQKEGIRSPISMLWIRVWWLKCSHWFACHLNIRYMYILLAEVLSGSEIEIFWLQQWFP